MNQLVTGANGFSGRNLLSILRAQNGSEVFGVDLAAALGVDSCDLTDASAVRDLLERVTPDRIYHLVGTFSNNWDTDFSANVDTARILLETIRELDRPCRVLLVGSAAEYGEVSPGPVVESMPLHPISVYGLTKAIQTELMGFYHLRYGLDVVLARPFNLYGDGCPVSLFPGHVASEIEKVRRGQQKKIHVQSLDSQRDYLHVSDAVRAYIRILDRGTAGEVYHVASGRPIGMRDFLMALISPHGLTLEDVEISCSPLTTKPNVSIVYADTKKFEKLFL